MNIDKVIYIFRSLGVGGIYRTIHYAISRDIINKRFSKKSPVSDTIFPGDIQQIAHISSGVRVDFNHASVDLEFLSQNLIKVSWSPGNAPAPYTIDKTDWEIQQPIIETDNESCSLHSGNLFVTISSIGEISYQDNQKNILHHDERPFLVGDSWHLSSKLKTEEHIYGLGERAASLNLRPGKYTSWNTDVKGSYSTGTDPLYIGTPIYLSLSKSGSHLVYFENSFKSIFSIDDKFEAEFEGGMLRYYIIFGSIETIFKQLSELVGRPFLPPRWVFGYHQSRWGYQSAADIRRVINGFEERDLPISAIHLDIDYMDGYRVFSINPVRFPDMKQLANELKDKGINIVTTLNPAVKQDQTYSVYTDGLSKNVFCTLPDGSIFRGVSWPGWSVFPDFSDPKAREWWGEQYQSLLNAGISGFWHDMNEPSSFSAWGDITFPRITTHDFDGHDGNHVEAHNLYGLLMNRAGFEGYRKNAPDKRPWIFSRSGWAGLQRYAWNWTGDVETSWQSLKQTLTTILGLGLSGHPFAGVDIGGFSGSPDAELYLRWFQMATFLSLYRTHSSLITKPREPWVFGEEITNIIRTFLKLRYKLLPYLYTLAWDTAQTGIPPVRPLFWENPADPSLWDIDDEFLLGDGILIAPVVSQGAQTRIVHLPPGIWYSLWSDQKYIGPTQFELNVSLDMIPIFIRGGTILPMEDGEKIILHIYPNTNTISSSHMYSDAGDGYGAWRKDHFHLNCQNNFMKITTESEGSYTFPYTMVSVVLHGKKLLQATSDSGYLTIQGNTISTSFFTNLIIKFD